MLVSSNQLAIVLEAILDQYNRRWYVSTDPIKFLYQYDDVKDREIVGLIASSLAYGRVDQILKIIPSVLEKIGSSPYEFVKCNSYDSMYLLFKGFKYRFTNAEHVTTLLFGVKKVLDKFGSLNNCFKSGFVKSRDHVLTLTNLTYFVRQLTCNLSKSSSLIPDPRKKSACKRLNLFLRWMIRNDNIDTGSWSGVPTSILVIPLDTHMHKIGLKLGFTKRRYASFKTAVEITSGFRLISPDDPVKYDFSLTRLGMLKGANIDDFFKKI